MDDKAYTYNTELRFINWSLGGGHHREMVVSKTRWWLTRLWWLIIRRDYDIVMGCALIQRDVR